MRLIDLWGGAALGWCWHLSLDALEGLAPTPGGRHGGGW